MRAYVLIVERHLYKRETAVDLFETLGHSALGASSPVRGIEMLEAMRFDAIMISPSVTLREGPSYATNVKKIQPHVAVIVVAALELPEFLEPPIDAFIQIPLSLILIEDAMRKLFLSGSMTDDYLC